MSSFTLLFVSNDDYLTEGLPELHESDSLLFLNFCRILHTLLTRLGVVTVEWLNIIRFRENPMIAFMRTWNTKIYKQTKWYQFLESEEGGEAAGDSEKGDTKVDHGTNLIRIEHWIISLHLHE